MLSIDRFFSIILSLSWLYPVLITFFILITFFSFFQIIKNYQKKTDSKILIAKRKEIKIFHKKTKEEELKKKEDDKKRSDLYDIEERNKIADSKKLFKESKSLQDLSLSISSKAEKVILSSVIAKNNPAKKPTTHTESFKVSAPKRRYSK